MRLLRILTAAALLAGGCCDGPFGEPAEQAGPQPATITIRRLNELFLDTTVVVEGDIVVSGTVTAGDSGGNFYRTICIGQDGAGMEILAGVDRLYNDYPVGCGVTLRLKGLALGRSRGVLQAGRSPAAGSGYATDYIGSKPALDAVLSRSGETLSPPDPIRTTIGGLTSSMCGALIRIERVRYSPEGADDRTWSGYRRFTDTGGREIYTYVRNYADFAGREIPTWYLSLTGILQREGSRYILKPRDENDLRF